MIDNDRIENIKPSRNTIIVQLIVLAIMIYLFVKCLSIYGFLTDYLSNKYMDEIINFGIRYVNILMFISVASVIIFSIVFYFIMRKKKEEKFYIVLIVYYILLFVCFWLFFRVLSQLQLVSFSENLLNFMKNFILFFSLVQIPLMIGLVLKVLGIKFRDFKNNESVTNDKEEVVKKGFRRSFKEWKYYFVENKPILIIIIIALVFVISLVIFINSDNIFKSYSENREVEYSNITFKVEESYLTEFNYGGKKVSNDKKYVVVQVNFVSNSDKKTRDFVIASGENIYYSNTSIAEHFADFGEAYKGNATGGNTLIFVYEFDKDTELNRPKFRIYDSNEYKEVRLSLEEDNNIKVVDEYNRSREVDFSESNLSGGTLKITEYEVGDSFSEKYRYCVNNKCYNGVNNINPIEVYTENKTILKINAEVTKEDNIYAYKKFNTISKFLYAFGSVNYTDEDKTITSSFTDITPVNFDSEYSYFLVDKNIKDSNNIDFIITIRDKRYIINLN